MELYPSNLTVGRFRWNGESPQDLETEKVPVKRQLGVRIEHPDDWF
jgi:hypothetical protein